MKRSKILVACLLVIVFAGLIAGVYYWHRGAKHNESGFTSGPPPSLVSLLPEAPYVIYADVKALRASEFLTRLIAMVPAPAEDPEYLDFVRATGFDYTRDLDQVAIAVFPTSPRPVVMTIAEGRFDQQKIITYALKTGTAEQKDGRTTYLMPASTPGDKVALSFLATNRIKLVTGPSAGVYLSVSDTHETPMAERVSRVGGSALFAIARADSIPKDLMIGTMRLDQIASSLKGVQWLTLAANPEKENLRVVLEGECDTASNARQLDLALSGFRMLGRALLSEPATRKQLTPQGAVALTDLVRVIDISHEGQRVRLSAALTPEMVNGFAAPAPPQKQSPAAKPGH